jgi:DNA mismatch repair protein MutL
MASNRVRLLDETTANQIAAGEVVERPASAVKELVENAIDAAATQITVSLEEGGKLRLVVMDNGCGMTRDDAVLALHRHATSKIESAEDLFAIVSLGFRGEALPSIASVSRFTLTTKPPDESVGTQLIVNGGDIVGVEEVAARDGTTVEIADLFFNTPARLKFLKSTPTEVARSVEVVGQLAAANPAIAFRVRHGSQEVFSSPGTGDTLSALAAVWGRDVARKLIPIRQEAPGLNVTGFIATPDISRPGRSHELFFVNRRPIKSRLLGHALEEAYRALTPESRYPVAAVFVEISPELVDVNVHPTKTEVKFTRDGEVHHAVSQAVKGALLAYGIVPTARPSVPVPGVPESSGQTHFVLSRASERHSLTEAEREAIPSILAAFAPIETVSPFAVSSLTVPNTTEIEEAGAEVSPLPDAGAFVERARPKPFAEQLREFRVLGQARNTYIVALTPDGIAVVDQHVAHERVLYERLTIQRFSNGIPSQRLVVPVTLNLSRREALLLAEQCESFNAAGWEIAPFGGESFVVRAVPAMLANKPYESVLRDMIDELVNQTVARRLLVQRDHVTITNACKMAVKAGDPLNLPEMEGLLEQLAETENPYLCPHGRPIVVTISFHELDKQFKRA